MMPKYITQEALDRFITVMDDIKTEQMVEDPNINELLQGKTPPDMMKDLNVYEIAESFLYLFQSRENYELCQMLVNNWPQLKTK
jgi:hypothetical protein